MNGPRQTMADRDIRQRALVPADRLAACHGLVVGVGAIGRQVAIQLAALGLRQTTLIDPDTVGVENLAVQAYWREDLGRQKTDATGSLCRRINPDLRLSMLPERFRRSMARADEPRPSLGVFACVDRISTRRFIWQSVASRQALLIDGRMSGEVVRVLTTELPDDHHYQASLFGQDEAYTGACTARSTVYSATIAAGLMVCQFTKWLRRLPLETDLMLNLLSAELTVSEGTPGIHPADNPQT
jgi:molybdopterin-synthase adenylyltransferase